MMKMRGIENDSYCQMLLDKNLVRSNIDTKQMSLGVKRKHSCATFMHDPDIFILDEPTSD